MIEIERKFLVKSDAFKSEAISESTISQGFLTIDPERTVRVRTKNSKGFITVKGKSNAAGTTRFEWEKEVPIDEAEKLLSLCLKHIIVKKRYKIKAKNHIFEVDEFYDKNKGLVIAEIELSSEDESFIKPDWLGKEVTGEIKYYNSQLSKHPFKNWEKEKL
ncbi:CYTH domain-containing protein [Flavobacteriaceae bacterium R38]|nr:CYTH domain-containing protein [Flavobacteriaceae bacterium R38]